MPGPPIPMLLVILFCFFFSRQCDRSTQYQERRSTLNDEKKGMALVYVASLKAAAKHFDVGIKSAGALK